LSAVKVSYKFFLGASLTISGFFEEFFGGLNVRTDTVELLIKAFFMILLVHRLLVEVDGAANAKEILQVVSKIL
jgi:hypothetical protein